MCKKDLHEVEFQIFFPSNDRCCICNCSLNSELPHEYTDMNRPRYKFTLSAHTLSYAANQLREPKEDKDRHAAIDSLLSEFKSQYPRITLKREDDEFILSFLRARKFDQGASIELLKNYHVIRNDWRELFHKIEHPILLEELFDRGVVCPLQGRSKSGGFVLVTRFGKNDPARFTLDNIALFVLTLQHLNEDEATQIYGFIVIHDLSEIRSPRQLDRDLASRQFYVLNHCMPIRPKKVFFVNNPIVFTGIYRLVSAILGERIKSKIIVLGKNYEQLHEYVDPIVLPRFLGGKVSDHNIEGWMNKIIGREKRERKCHSENGLSINVDSVHFAL